MYNPSLKSHILYRELNKVVAALFFTLIYNWTYVPMSALGGYGLFLDFLTRVGANEAFIGSYYFWWTSLTYVPFFFFTLLLIIGIRNPQTAWGLLSCASLAVFPLYLIEFSDYSSLNLTWGVVDSALEGFNILLTNALNRYHPCVFYSSVILLAYWAVLGLRHLFYRPSTQLTLKAPASFSSTLSAALVNIIALWMGSWWALQEGTWGGWWNWDSSETFGLLVLLIALVRVHARTETKAGYRAYLHYSVLFMFFTFSYFFIQLNFDLVSHNFGSKFFFFFNNNLFFLEVGVVLLGAAFVYFTRLSNVVKFTCIAEAGNRARWVPSDRYLRFFVLSVPALWIIGSYQPLMNYFTWNFASLNLLNFDILMQPANFIGFILLFIWLSSPVPTVSAFQLIYTAMTGQWLWGAPFSVITRGLVVWLHLSLLLFAATNLMVVDLLLASWGHHTEFDYLVGGAQLLVTPTNLSVADGTSFELVKLWSDSYWSHSTSWNLYSFSNSPSVNFFSLNAAHNVFSNIYTLSTLDSLSSTFLELPMLPSANSFAFITFYSLMRLQFSKNLTRRL